jgi:hypothetical protein
MDSGIYNAQYYQPSTPEQQYQQYYQYVPHSIPPYLINNYIRFHLAIPNGIQYHQMYNFNLVHPPYIQLV